MGHLDRIGMGTSQHHSTASAGRQERMVSSRELSAILTVRGDFDKARPKLTVNAKQFQDDRTKEPLIPD
jgi:hypothetical protein